MLPTGDAAVEDEGNGGLPRALGGGREQGGNDQREKRESAAHDGHPGVPWRDSGGSLQVVQMRTLTPVLFGTVLAVACGKSSTAPTVTGYECLGQAYPTSAPASITVSGAVADFINGPVAGVTVYAFKTGTAGPIDSATTDAGGAFSMTVSTGGTPLDGYLKATKTGYLDTYAYPSAPLPASATISVPVVTSGEFSILATQAGASPVAGKGSLGLRPVNCAGAAVTGATVTTSSGTSPFADGQGDFFVFNAAPGNVDVGATFQSRTFHGHTIVAVADAVTITIIAPGPLSPPE